MKPITAELLAATAAARWDEQYGRATAADKVEIGRQLRELVHPTPAQVNEIIGNNSWTSVPGCDECGEDAAATVQIGQEPDYDSRTAYICAKCLGAALNVCPSGNSQ